MSAHVLLDLLNKFEKAIKCEAHNKSPPPTMHTGKFVQHSRTSKRLSHGFQGLQLYF